MFTVLRNQLSGVQSNNFPVFRVNNNVPQSLVYQKMGLLEGPVPILKGIFYAKILIFSIHLNGTCLSFNIKNT